MIRAGALWWVALLCMLIPLHESVGSAGTASGNILSNGGFEERGEKGLPSGWQIMPERDGKGDAVLDTKSVHSGTYSLKISPNKRNSAEGFGVFTQLDPEKVRGKDVTISGFAKLQGMGEAPAGILFKTDKDNWLILPQAVQGEFFFFSKTFPVANTIPHAFLFFIAGGNKGSAWIDDLSLTVEAGSAPKNLRTTKLTPSSGDPLINRINTPGWQDSAFISPDGTELYFAYMPYAQKTFEDIFFGRIDENDVRLKGPIREGSHFTMQFETYKAVKNKDGTWGKPVILNIGSSAAIAPYSAKLSFDGSELYYALRDHPGGYGQDDIYMSKKLSNGTWGPPENLGPQVNSEYRDDTPAVTADGRTLYFSRNKRETLGWEIYVSHRVNGKWTKAEKVGLPINESNPEKTANHQPFVTADGKEFYFTRIQQLYKSAKLSNGKWGKPVKVFPKLPLSGHASVTADGRYLYFLTVKDEESLKRSNWSIWFAERQTDGSWGPPRPVD